MSTSLRVVLVLFFASLLAWSASGNVIYARLSYLWLSFLLFNWIWASWSLKRVTLLRQEMHKRAEVGRVFGEKFDLHNKKRLPILWVEVQDEAQMALGRGNRVLTMLAGNQTQSYVYRSRLLRRGIYELGPTTLVSGDPFGMFRVKKTFAAQEKLLVYPTLVDIAHVPELPGLLPGGESLQRKTTQITPNAAGVREYAPGDPLSRIHWASTARRERLMVKEFELDPKAEIWIMLDASQQAHVSAEIDAGEYADLLWRNLSQVEMLPSTEEYAASAAASLARYYLSRGRNVGLMSNREMVDLLPPDFGPRQLDKILQFLALWQAQSGDSLLSLVTSQARYLPRGSTVILISSSASADIELCLDQFQRLGLRPIVILMDAASFGGAQQAAVELERRIQGMRIPVKSVQRGAALGQVLSIW